LFGIVYHVGYLTDDLEKAIEYYRITFGGELIKLAPPSATGKIAYVQIGESEVELIQPADTSRLNGRTGLVIDHVGYFVPNIEKAIAELKSRGIKFATPEPTVTPVGYRVIYLDAASTMGTRIHLAEK